MASANYITASDVTALVAQDFDMSGYLERTNNHIEYIAYSYNTTPTNIDTPVHFILKEYGIAYCLRELYRDKIGVNNIDVPDQDKYVFLYKMQNDEVEKLRKSITTEMFSNDATDSNSNSAGTCVIFRG